MRCRLRVADEDGGPSAHVPVAIDVFDAAGERTPYGTYLATGPDGEARSTFRPAPLTDPKGEWRIEARELLSGKGADRPVRLRF